MADLLQFPLPFLNEVPAPEVPPYDPYTDSLDLSDPEARIAALDIHRSWIVEAPAGSGKTGLLIQRFLKLLAFGDVQRPGEILAITFTRKAANELRTRVLEQLGAAAANKPHASVEYERTTRQLAAAALERDRSQGWRLLESPHQLNIRTIDSFCGDLAGRVPLLSGNAGRTDPVDDATPLYEEAARRAFRELGGPDRRLSGALRNLLLHRDAQIHDCVRLVADMLAHREQWGELIPLDSEKLEDDFLDQNVLPRLQATLEHAICRGLTRASRLVDPHLFDELASFAARLSIEPGTKGADSPIAVCAGRPRMPGTSAPDLAHWLALIGLLLKKEGDWRTSTAGHHLGFDLSRDDSEWLRQIITQLRAAETRQPALREALCAIRCLPPAQYPPEQWRLAKALFHILRRALVELTLLFAERGVCDFPDLALTARSLLRRGQTDLLHTPGQQLTHLLVDEMQDTSAGQYDLFDLLTQDWDGHTQTVFLVGDPKQSIYGFRQASVERFLRTQAEGRLGHIALGALRLTANFRSQAALVEDFNRTFGRILPGPRESSSLRSQEVDVPFVAASPVRAAGVRPALNWHLRIEQDSTAEDHETEDDKPALTVEDEARSMRRIIEDFAGRWRQRPVEVGAKPKPPRIAVLARTRAHLAPVMSEFHRDFGNGPLPFRAVDIELLSETPEVLDLVALTRALLHPADRVAWLSLLHSPVCGLGLADLLTLTGEGPGADRSATVAHLVRTRAHLLSPESQNLLSRTWRVLSEAQASLGRTGFSTHVERTWRSLGADAALTPDRATNARRFLSLLKELEFGPEPLTIPLLERRLRKLYAQPPSGPACVELMTIHKAKGLEWDLVLVPALERGSGNSRHELLRWLEMDADEGPEAGVIFAPIASKGEDSSALSSWLGGLQRERETAEAKRLFYVASTRAREELHLFGACAQKGDGSLRAPRYDSLLRASWAAAEPIALAQLATPEPTGTVPASPRGELHVLPAPATPPTPLALAAAADIDSLDIGRHTPTLRRLPPDFDPLGRLRPELGPDLPYPPAALLRSRAPFARPEGSFAARAFGNVVHRFFELAADRLAAAQSPNELRAELPSWHPRILTAFRTEGLAPALALRDTERTLTLLQATLDSPFGRWVLSPHTHARSERGLQIAPESDPEQAVRNIRADRVFVAGPQPLSTGEDTHLWIVDFKTADPGGRAVDSFLEAEKQKYWPQMQAYARASAAAAGDALPIMLALFYPAITRLLYWPFDPFLASQHIESATDTVPW